MNRIILIFLLAATVGFAQQPNEWKPRGIGGGGALFSPAFNPWKSKEIFMPCDMSETFHTTDLGKSWTPLDFRQIQSNTRCKATFTKNGGMVYALDGSNDQSRIKFSSDGGATWTFLANEPTGGEVYGIWADPGNENRLLVSSYNTLYFSDDRGQTFKQKYQALDNNSGLHVAGVFFDTVNIFVGTNDGLLVSLNHGSTFFIEASHGGIPQGETMVAFAGAEVGGEKRFYCITHSQVYAGIQGHDYSGYRNVWSMGYHTTAPWVQRSSMIPSGNYPFFLDMAQNNLDVFYVAGGSDNGTPVVFKSTNGGITFQSVFETLGNQNIATGWSGDGGDRGWSYGEYPLGFDVADLDPNYVTITDLGFVHVTSNGGNTWAQAYVKPKDQNSPNAKTPKKKPYHSVGLENTTAWQVYWFDSTTMFGCFSDIRGIRSTDKGATWSFDHSGLTHNSTYRIVKDRVRETWYAAVSSVHDLYQSTYLTDAKIDNGSGSVMYTTDKGASWKELHDFGAPVVWVATDPSHTDKLYVAVAHSINGGIYVTDNVQNLFSATWQKLPNPPRTEGHPSNIITTDDGTLIVSYSGRRNGAGVFTPSSGIFISTNGGSTWIDRSDPAMHYWTQDVILDPHDGSQNTWYAGVFSGWGGAPNGTGGLYKTSNRGMSWTRIHNDDRVTSCTFHPTDPDELYFTTEQDGLFLTHNAQAVSPNFTSVSNYSFRQPERVFYNPYNANEIWVTSFGNGMRVGDRANTPPLPVKKLALVAPADQADSVVPNSVSFLWHLDDNAKTYTLEYSTDVLFQLATTKRLAPIYDTTIGAALADNTTYYWRARGENESGAGPWSDVWHFTTSSRVPEKVRLYVPATLDSNIIPNVYVMKWWPLDSITGYQLEIRKNDVVVKLLDLGITPSTLTPALDYYTWYSWRVRALNGATYGPWSETRVFKTAPEPPAAPNLVSPANDSVDVPRSYRLIWQWPERADNFIVHVSKTPDFANLDFADDQIFGTLVNFMYLDAHTKYYWRVRGKNEGGLGAWSEVWSFTTSSDASVRDDRSPVSSLVCIPNPIVSRAELRFELPSAETVSIQVMDILGRETARIAEGRFDAGRHSVDWLTSQLGSGRYFIELRTLHGIEVLPVEIRK